MKKDPEDVDSKKGARDILDHRIQETQLKIIGKCRNLYKYIDYLHDRKKDIPLKDKDVQPPNSILNALLYKMKADIMTQIYECLSGDNGLLKDDKAKSIFFDQVKKREEQSE